MSRSSRRLVFTLALLPLLLLSCAAAFGQTFTTLYSFSGPDGSFPLGQLIQGQDGYLYSTTHLGGDGWGTIFKIAPDGTGFTSLSLPGYLQTPWSGLSQGADGSLYGTGIFGGIPNPGNAFANAGTVFKVQPDFSGLTQLYAFTGTTDGGWPYSAPLPGNDGFLYGGTQAFGDAVQGSGSFGDGVLYKLATDGSSYTVLHTFNGSDGSGAYGGLILGADGFLYGTTYNGGAANFGTVFKISRDGGTFQSLYSFTTDFGDMTALVQGSDGLLYGTSIGASDGSQAGDVFKLAPDGTGFTDLAAFGPYNIGSVLGIADKFPRVTVTLGPDGNLYGSSISGGTNGTLFRMRRDGTGFTVLHTFSPLGASNINSDGAWPLATMIASNGCLYGTTPYGGAYGHGTIFKMTLPPMYGIVALYDQTKAVKSGATIPIKIQVDSSAGANVSSPSLAVHATGVTQVSSSAPSTLQDAGNANPDSDFRYDATVGGTGGYVYNLKTTAYTTGTYQLNFTIGGGSTTYSVQFSVR
jgi:uncharacterized repeat protein (TIGR03803 family)